MAARIAIFIFKRVPGTRNNENKLHGAMYTYFFFRGVEKLGQGGKFLL